MKRNQPMKTNLKDLFLLPALIAVLNLMLAGLVTAQTFTTLHSFTASITNSSGVYTNSDGANPRTGLILAGNTLYGTAEDGGSSGRGTLFAFNPDGTGFTNLHSFTATSGSGGYYGTNSEGAIPNGLVLSNNTLYGTASQGGGSGYGTVFAVNTDGTGFTNLHNFTAVVYDPTLQNSTNSDGAYPNGVILSNNTLYGTAYAGGGLAYGTVFAVNTDGSGFTNLHDFTGAGGGHPYAGLILAGNTLYGTAEIGGGGGTVFALGTDGTGFTNLYGFTGFDDGAHPKGRLLLSGGTLYGTTFDGGILRLGAVFALNTDGTGFMNLHSFTGDGTHPYPGLTLSGNTLYGTAYRGGSSGSGTIFSLSFRPQLSITPSGTNVVLSWPISYAGFNYGGYYLQETEDLGSAGGWISVVDTNLPVIVNGQIEVTRPMLGPQISYRLAR